VKHPRVTAAEKYAEGPQRRCDCHGEEMRWQANERLLAGGRWQCRIDAARHYPHHPKVSTANKRADLEARGEPWPVCDCHGEPRYWKSDPYMIAGGIFLACPMLDRERNAKYRKANPEEVARRNHEAGQTPGTARFNAIQGIGLPGLRAYINHRKWTLSTQRIRVAEQLAEVADQIAQFERRVADASR